MFRDDEDAFERQVRRDYEAHLRAYLITRSTRRWAVALVYLLAACIAVAKLLATT